MVVIEWGEMERRETRAASGIRNITTFIGRKFTNHWPKRQFKSLHRISRGLNYETLIMPWNADYATVTEIPESLRLFD